MNEHKEVKLDLTYEQARDLVVACDRAADWEREHHPLTSTERVFTDLRELVIKAAAEAFSRSASEGGERA